MPKKICSRCAMGHDCPADGDCQECLKHIAIYRKIFKIHANSFTDAINKIDEEYGLENFPVSPRLRDSAGNWVFVYYGCSSCSGEVKNNVNVEYSPDGFNQGTI